MNEKPAQQQSLKRRLGDVKAILRSLFPHCRDVVRLQSEAPDRALSCDERLGLQVHLLICSWCRRYRKQISLLRHAMDEHPDTLSSANSQSLSPEARARLRQKIRCQG